MTDFRFRDAAADTIRTDLLVIPVTERGLEKPPLYLLDRRLRGKLSDRIQKTRFSGGEGNALVFPTAGVLAAANLLLTGMGKPEEVEIESWRRMAARVRKEAAAIGVADVAFYFDPDEQAENAAAPIVEGTLLASYQFNKYRSSSRPPADLATATIFRPGLRRTQAMERSVRLVEQT